MGTGTIRSQPELNEENIVVKNSHARGENSSVDRKHISDFMGKRRVELHRTTYLLLGYLSHGGNVASGDNPEWVRSADGIRPRRAGRLRPSADTLGVPFLEQSFIPSGRSR